MAVIRDVNLGTTNDNVIFIGTICALLCLIVAVLGIKLRWFKHRMNFNDIPTTSTTPNQSNGIEPQIIRATFRPSADFDNYVEEVTTPKVLPPVRIPKSSRNAISLPPRKRQAPDVPILRVSNTETNSNEIEPLRTNSTNGQIAENSLVVEERRKSTPPPPLPTSPPPDDHPENQLLLLETNNNYNHQEEETRIQIKEDRNVSEMVPPSPPPYQVVDPLAHNHFKKFTKKKTSSAPLPSPHKFEIVAVDSLENAPSPTSTKLFNSLHSPKDSKNDRKQSFLHQVETPTEIPKLAFDFPSASMHHLKEPSSETLLTPTQSTFKLAKHKPKSNEKKSFLGLFGMKLSGKSDNDSNNKNKNENKQEHPILAKNEMKQEHPLVAKIDKKQEHPVVAKIEKQKVKKIRVLKSDKKENVPKVKVDKNVRVASQNGASGSIEKSEMKVKEEQSIDTDLAIPNLELIENRMEIDYFHKVKKVKPNRVPIIVNSPKAQIKSEKKQMKNKVFRHEETFSAANGPIKVKKKKAKTTREEPITASQSSYNDPIKIKPSSSPKLNEDPPIPKPRVILNLDGFDDNNQQLEIKNKPKRNVEPPVLSSPSSPSDTEFDTWNLVAQHRLNTRAVSAAPKTVQKNSDADGTTNGSALQIKQIEMLNKPKTMREMKREQEERRAQFSVLPCCHMDTTASAGLNHADHIFSNNISRGMSNTKNFKKIAYYRY